MGKRIDEGRALDCAIRMQDAAEDPKLAMAEYLIAVGFLLHAVEAVDGVSRKDIDRLVEVGRQAAAEVARQNSGRAVALEALAAAKRAR